MNSSSKGCLIFSFLLLIPFLIDDVEAINIHSHSFGIYNSSDWSDNSTDVNYPSPKNFTFPITINNTNNSFLIMGLSGRDQNPEINDVFFGTNGTCHNEEITLTKIPNSFVNDTTRTNPSTFSEIYNATLTNQTTGDHNICINWENTRRITHVLLATAVLFQNFFEADPIGDVKTNKPDERNSAVTLVNRNLTFNCLEKESILFATFAKFLSRDTGKIGLQEGEILASPHFNHSGAKAASGYAIKDTGGSFTFNFTNTNTQSFAISGVQIRGSQPLSGCIVDPDDSLGFVDKISLSISKTLTETLGISDSISIKPSTIYLSETLSISGLLDYHKDHTITKSLTETLGILDILDYILSDPPIVEPEPLQAVTVQKSSGSSGGSRTGVDVSSKISDIAATTSMDRIANWLSTPEHFKVALHNLIQQDIVDLEVSQIKDPPAWFYQTVEFWSTEQIDDEEFFNALEFILKN